MNIIAFPSGPLLTNAYVLSCPSTSLAAIVDPSPGSFKKITEFLTTRELNPIAILLTHSHWDHISDVSFLKETYHIPVYIHEEDQANLVQPGADGIPCLVDIPGVVPDVLLKEGSIIRFGDTSLEVIHTPGHSAGSICFYNSTAGILVSGDTLFRGGMGNISFPTSTPHLMLASLTKLGALPDETRVFPGHGSPTTIQAEERIVRRKRH